MLDIEEQSCSDRSSVMDGTQEIPVDRHISSRTARVLHTVDIETDEKLDREIDTKYIPGWTVITASGGR